ncbi:MAG TPA: response regulator transcription factor [Bacteroidota bacterium]|nr:response regulator transcription factor [Bacteroidota bacterium]
MDDVSTNMTVNVGIIEDDPSIRESVASLINSAAGFSCGEIFESVESAIENISRPPPDVLLMDINLGGMSGIEGVRRLKGIFPKMNILMLTVFEENDKIFQSLCAGASGYLLKRTPPAKILDAISEVHQGGAPMTASVARKVLSLFTSIAPPTLPDLHLTARELEILQHLVSGSSYKKISRDLFISFDTVNSHIKNIYEKLQVHSKTEAVAKALKHRLV